MNVLLPCHCNALRQATRVMTTFYDDRLRPIGLRVSQYSMLQIIRQHPGIATGDIGKSLDLDQTSASRALATLFRNDWVHSEGGLDRREKHWSLAPKGHAMLKKAHKIWLSSQREVEERLGTPTTLHLHALSRGVVDAISGA
jgi:DNA-binding MarR family transcriptional regulator